MGMRREATVRPSITPSPLEATPLPPLASSVDTIVPPKKEVTTEPDTEPEIKVIVNCAVTPGPDVSLFSLSSRPFI
jgi:hypothetical protein